jgi:hypothetical protein
LVDKGNAIDYCYTDLLENIRSKVLKRLVIRTDFITVEDVRKFADASQNFKSESFDISIICKILTVIEVLFDVPVLKLVSPSSTIKSVD